MTIHDVGVSANVMLVTSLEHRGEHVDQFEMFAILKYVAIKPRILGPLSGNRRCHD